MLMSRGVEEDLRSMLFHHHREPKDICDIADDRNKGKTKSFVSQLLVNGVQTVLVAFVQQKGAWLQRTDLTCQLGTNRAAGSCNQHTFPAHHFSCGIDGEIHRGAWKQIG